MPDLAVVRVGSFFHCLFIDFLFIVIPGGIGCVFTLIAVVNPREVFRGCRVLLGMGVPALM